MKCMKCGREMESDQAFCTDCLMEMRKYPVKPDVHVHLPVRPKVQPIRKQVFRRKNYGPEEQIRKLKKRVMILTGALIVTLTLLCAMVYPTVTYFLRNYHLRPGQNYNTVTVTEAAETTEAPLDQ